MAPPASTLRAHGVTTKPAELDALVEQAVARLRRSLGEDPKQALSPDEVATLKRGGFDLAVHANRADKVAAGVAEYSAMLATGLRVAAVAKLLRVNQSRIRQRLTSRPKSLLGARVGRTWRVPAFQFDIEQRRVVPGFEAVLRAVDPELSALSLQRWFLAPSPDLIPPELGKPISPRDWLRLGLPIQAVVTIAKGL